MKRTILSLIIATLWTVCAVGQTVSGQWTGTLNVGHGVSLTIVLNISEDDDGKPKCTLDSPDQGAKGIAAEVHHLGSDSINIAIPSISASYAAGISEGRMQGVFTQMGMPLRLDMRPGGVSQTRPQTPRQPYPYDVEEVTFDNPQAKASFAGTLTLPRRNDGKKPPVVLMVSGSGQQNRDDEIFGHRPFLVIADYLARHGIASLRYDDRGMGRSTGSAVDCTTEDFMRDAEAGIGFLRHSGRFSSVGVIGHSEGGTIAFMLAARGKADFIVALAAPGAKGDTILAEQNNAMLRLAGMAPNVTAADVLRKTAAMTEGKAWRGFFTSYDPAADIGAAKCPVMALGGSLDMQVTPHTNLDAIRRLLPQNRLSTVKEYAGLNHLFQHATTGMPTEYAKIEETFAPEVLADMAAWIMKVAQ